MSKLPRGLFKRPNRRSYYCRVTRNGEEKVIAVGPNLREAERRLHALRLGEPLPTRVSIEDAAAKWLELYVSTRRNAKGQKLAAVRVKMYLLEFFGGTHVSKIKPDDLRAYRLWIEKQGASAQTVAHILSDARALFSWAEDNDMVDRTPFRKKLMPRIQEQPPKALSDDEVAVLTSLPDPLGFVCRLGLGSGLRWAELCNARADHVENGMLVVSMTKSGKVRRVPLSEDLLREIRTHIGLLVPYSASNPAAFMRRVQRTTKMMDFHPHRMRHTFATHWIARGGNLAALQAVLGHASITTTQRYAKLSDQMVQAEARRIEEA